MKIRNALLTLAASATLFAFGSQAANANAETWHKGVPKFVTNHREWTSGYHRVKDFNHGYIRYLLFFSKDSYTNDETTNGYGTEWYNSSKKSVGAGDAEGLLVKPMYKKIGKDTYLIKGTKDVKEQFNFKYKITRHGKNSISVSTKGDYKGFHKWVNFGKFKPDSKLE